MSGDDPSVVAVAVSATAIRRLLGGLAAPVRLPDGRVVVLRPAPVRVLACRTCRRPVPARFRALAAHTWAHRWARLRKALVAGG